MSQDELYNYAAARRFLLGEMAAGERSAFEEGLIADHEIFESTRVAEDELIEAYVRDTLSASEKTLFEENFLTTDRRRERVAFTQSMITAIAGGDSGSTLKKTPVAGSRASMWKAVSAFFTGPKLAFGIGLAVTLMMVAVWLVIKTTPQPEIVRQVTPTPSLQPTQIQNSTPPASPNVNGTGNAQPASNAAVPNKNQNSETQKPNFSERAPVLALFAGTSRAGGKMAELTLPEGAPGANLQLHLESRDYKIYNAEIVDPDGNPVAKTSNLKAKGSTVAVFVAAAKLRRGDYILKLNGLNPQNQDESVADYPFRVIRK